MKMSYLMELLVKFQLKTYQLQKAIISSIIYLRNKNKIIYK